MKALEEGSPAIAGNYRAVKEALWGVGAWSTCRALGLIPRTSELGMVGYTWNFRVQEVIVEVSKVQDHCNLCSEF